MQLLLFSSNSKEKTDIVNDSHRLKLLNFTQICLPVILSMQGEAKVNLIINIAF